MTGAKNRNILPAFIVGLFAAAATAVFLNDYYAERQFVLLSTFCGEVAEAQPQAEQVIFEILKNKNLTTVSQGGELLRTFGYRPADFSADARVVTGFAAAAFFAAGLLLLTVLWYWNRHFVIRIRRLTENLEKINTGQPGMLWETSEDEFSKLQDAIYKTVTALQETRDAALKAKNNFADNLANIAHQLKTPVTAISLSAQMMRESCGPAYLSQIEKQTRRLVHLEESLLLLARIDAGALSLKRETVDVFTLLCLAADNLQELCRPAGVCMEVPELGEVHIQADMDWTMEAVMNLMKNCLEHSPKGGTVHCSYEKNPLYVRILIYDEGPGFAQEDVPHLFERFYRGKAAREGSVGIGLSLAREIIELQSGVISAASLSGGGASFEIRFYAS